MITVFNWAVPFVGYRCLTIWPFIFVRDDLMIPFNDIDYNHESIHGRQQLEVLPIGIVLCGVLALVGCGWWSLFALPLYFYWYCLEYIVRIIVHKGDGKTAYRNICFEQEAYINERDMEYLDNRKWFAWVKYLTKTTF